MTLNELAAMRRMRARPAFPIILTDDSLVHLFCADNDLPVIWTPGLPNDADFSPLHNLPVWVVASGQHQELLSKVREHRPESMWVCGAYGFSARINDAVGRVVLWN